jgi:C1A family cysteine protease
MQVSTKKLKGWLPDRPDTRDYTIEQIGFKTAAALPASVDLRQWCSPIEDQGNIGSCTANAAVGLVEYMERRAHGRHVDHSRRFVYKMSRWLAGIEGDQGCYLHTTIGALRVYGTPPEMFWPYDEAAFDVMPGPEVFGLADDYQPIEYARIDENGKAPVQILADIKAVLSAGHCAIFGFTCYESLQRARGGVIPYPAPGERVVGGHAVMACGYDDAREALLIRNSWGADWGDSGYGWLPFRYVTDGLAVDFWTITSQSWIDSKQFGFREA